jgi:hypothetical protein
MKILIFITNYFFIATTTTTTNPHPQAFLPSIPNLVYQYNLYTNYPSAVFAKKNPEIPE